MLVSTPRIDVALRQLVLSLLAAPLGLYACSQSAHDAARSDAGLDAPTADAPTDDALAPDGGGADATDPCRAERVDAAIYDDAGAQCADFRRLPCGVPADAGLRNCLPSFAACAGMCGQDVLFGCQLTDASCDEDAGLRPDADVVVECVRCLNAGRRPRGLEPATAARASSALGAYFAELGYLEAASIRAFRDLDRSLAALAAPRRLRLAAQRAARDERRHAVLTRRLARRFGGAVPRPRALERAPAELAELLADNVVEGCVGESYGALVALWQAERAGDDEVARAMRTLARDELRHAALAWDLLAWAAPRVDAAQRARLRALAQAALARLRDATDRPVDASVVAIAGHPPRHVARSLHRGFAALVGAELERVLEGSAGCPS